MSDIAIDLWPALQKGLGYTYPSTGPVKRIDYIFASPALSKCCKEISLVGTLKNQNGVYPSDHFGLLAFFSGIF